MNYNRHLKKLLLASSATIVVSLILSCKINIDADKAVEEANKTIKTLESRQPNNTQEKTKLKDEKNETASSCDEIQLKQDELFAVAKDTQYPCTQDSDCTVLKGFSGCHFAAIAKDDGAVISTFTGLFKDSKIKKCKFNVCLTIRAFDAVCNKKKCDLK